MYVCTVRCIHCRSPIYGTVYSYKNTAEFLIIIKKTEFLFKSRHGVNDTALYMSPRKHKMAILFLIVIGLDGSIQK